MNPVSVLRVKFVSQNLRYFVSFKGIPFTYTDVPSPCYQQTEKVLPHEEMEECEAAFECTPPVSESIFRNVGGDRGINELWEDIYCRVRSLAHKGFYDVI